MSKPDETARPAYHADETPAPAAPPPPPLAGEPAAEANRGRRAQVTAAGEVIGSGASAGGKGNPENIDPDAAGGDGQRDQPHPDRPDRGADGRKHGSA